MCYAGCMIQNSFPRMVQFSGKTNILSQYFFDPKLTQLSHLLKFVSLFLIVSYFCINTYRDVYIYLAGLANLLVTPLPTWYLPRDPVLRLSYHIFGGKFMSTAFLFPFFWFWLISLCSFLFVPPLVHKKLFYQQI